MADTVASQKLVDGARNVVMKFTNSSDGTGESAVVKVDVSGLNGAPSEVKILGIKYSTRGMGVDILWDATSPVVAFHVPADADGVFDFQREGGLINNGGAGKTGDIKFTTVGHASGDLYTIELLMAKRG